MKKKNAARSKHSSRATPNCQALTVIFRHPAITSDPSVVCNLLQTCKSWRLALQQLAAGNTVVDFAAKPLRSIDKIQCLAAWIPMHAGLLKEIKAHRRYEADQASRTHPGQEYWSSVAESLEQSFARAAAKPLLCLKSFSTIFFGNARLLQVLPAASLTRLSVDRPHVAEYNSVDVPEINSKAVALAVGRLTGLQDLSITGFTGEKDMMTDAIMEAISNLKRLTSLDLGLLVAGSNFGLLPAQLQQLHLCAYCCRTPTTVALGHLTALQQLKFELKGTPSPGSCLPIGLTCLAVEQIRANMENDWHVNNLGVTGLMQLRKLQLTDCLQDSVQLQQLSNLPKLEDLHLSYSTATGAHKASAAWEHLPSLQSIRIEAMKLPAPGGRLLSRDQAQRLCVHLGAATSLTRIFMHSVCDFLGGASICEHLTGLQRLCELELINVGGPSTLEDAHHLTALTALTKLHLWKAFGVNDVVATGVASRLKQLQHLHLQDCSISSAAVRPVVGCLTQLTHLCLSGPQYRGLPQAISCCGQR